MFELPEFLCGMFGSQGVAAFCGGADGCRVVVCESVEGPCRGFFFRNTESVHPVEAAADIIVVAVCLVGDPFLFDEAAYGRGCPRDGGFATAFFCFVCLFAGFWVR